MGIYPSGTHQDGLQRISCLQKEVSAIVEFVPHTSHMINIYNLQKASMMILTLVSCCPLTVRLCLWWIDQLANTHQVLHLHFTAAVFLHVADTTLRGSLNDEMLDVLATTCLHQMMHAVVSMHDTLHRALRCDDSVSDSVYCLANVYLAALYYTLQDNTRRR